MDFCLLIEFFLTGCGYIVESMQMYEQLVSLRLNHRASTTCKDSNLMLIWCPNASDKPSGPPFKSALALKMFWLWFADPIVSCPGSCAEAGRLRRHIAQLQMEVAEASVQLQNLQKDNEHLKCIKKSLKLMILLFVKSDFGVALPSNYPQSEGSAAA